MLAVGVISIALMTLNWLQDYPHSGEREIFSSVLGSCLTIRVNAVANTKTDRQHVVVSSAERNESDAGSYSKQLKESEMLVLSRKKNEAIVIDGEIRIEVLKVKGNTIRLGITAPKDVRVLRGELAPFGKESELVVSEPKAETAQPPLERFRIAHAS